MPDEDARRVSERVRIPAPVIRRRLVSGRGATEQPNATGDGDAALTVTLWLAVGITGVATGLVGVAMMALLSAVEHVAFGYSTGSFRVGVLGASWQRRLLSLVVAGVVGGLGWYLLRRYTPGERSDVEDTLWAGDGTLSPRRAAGTAVLSELVIGMGASLGREAAPRLLGATSGSVLGTRLGLSPAQRRLLVACGAGAGLAAVYNVPLGGALFTAELLIGRITLPVVLPALMCSWIATAVAWIYLPSHATYTDVPAYAFSTSEMVWAVIAGPILGILAVGLIRGIGWISHHRPAGRVMLVAPMIAFVLLGLAGIHYPQLFGNGKGIAHQVFLGNGSLLLMFALVFLKPIVTGLCLSSGASGGLFTPTVATGALAGGLLGGLWSDLWAGTPVGAYAIIGAAALLGACMQAPLAALLLTLELTHTSFHLMVPMVAATALATAVARYLDGYSTYSARLPARGDPESDGV
ncbi:MAG TPA: chloride channel protein [Mycobacteriales bacterium]|nr:chloride channel protein [Mycobacteriales bacterium]